MLKVIKIQINGLHCESCKTLIETEVDLLEGVKSVKVNYLTGESHIEFDDEKTSQEDIFSKIEKLNYKIGENKKTPKKLSRNLIIAGILLIVFIAGYHLIKQFGLLEVLSKLNEQNISYWMLFLIGFLVSFHCVGMCGGLVVSYSVKNKGGYRSHIQYNLGRLISYSVIGGILGGVGSFFAINPTFTGTITLIAGTFMVLMGLSLLTNFVWLEKVKLRTPAFIARFLYNQRYAGKPKGPFVIGIFNGFMPCGPLQAMQIYALASGSIITGALSMGIYALGTVPLMFGLGSFISLISQDRIKQVMKFSGALVMVLGLFMLNRGLTNFGYGFRGFVAEETTIQVNADEYQIVEMELSYRGYSPNVIYIKKDIPVRWIINVKQMSGCTDEIVLKEYDIRKVLKYGENIIEFIPDKLGEIKFSCWMEMVWGKFIVTN
ncbi:sulfite exporter TauE/SafE family protein [Patescibacteria group bacterium]|nr:sulfite exporter TauE/SafE family protein [Patescibacteria group bacterium]